MIRLDHVVYVDTNNKSKDLEELLEGTRTMIIRCVTSRKLPYGRVNKGANLFLIPNNGEGLIQARCIVKSVFDSDKMFKSESIELVQKYQDKRNLTARQFKR